MSGLMDEEQRSKKPAWVDAYLREEERQLVGRESISLAAWKLMELVNDYAVQHGELPKSTTRMAAICDMDGRGFWRPWREIRHLYPLASGQRCFPEFVQDAIERRKARIEESRAQRRSAAQRRWGR